MKTFFCRTTLALALLAVFTAPVAAAPWCATWCDCSTPCWAQCYDEGGSSACFLYLCEDNCRAAAAATSDPADDLLCAITTPTVEEPAATESKSK